MRPGQILLCHLRYDPELARLIETLRVACLFLIRDPRDVLVSTAHFMPGRALYMWRVLASLPDTKSRIAFLLKGGGAPQELVDEDPSIAEWTLPPFAEYLRGWEGWLDSGAHVVRFEDLIGLRGGGGPELQRATVRGVYGFLGMPLPEDALTRLCARMYSRISPTFRKGGTGGWRQSFDDETKALFKERAGETVIRFGYESDDRW
jgi:hypothetical protein